MAHSERDTTRRLEVDDEIPQHSPVRIELGNDRLGVGLAGTSAAPALRGDSIDLGHRASCREDTSTRNCRWQLVKWEMAYFADPKVWAAFQTFKESWTQLHAWLASQGELNRTTGQVLLRKDGLTGDQIAGRIQRGWTLAQQAHNCWYQLREVAIKQRLVQT
jgi:hypothetical protein